MPCMPSHPVWLRIYAKYITVNRNIHDFIMPTCCMLVLPKTIRDKLILIPSRMQQEIY